MSSERMKVGPLVALARDRIRKNADRITDASAEKALLEEWLRVKNIPKELREFAPKRVDTLRERIHQDATEIERWEKILEWLDYCGLCGGDGRRLHLYRGIGKRMDKACKRCNGYGTSTVIMKQAPS